MSTPLPSPRVMNIAHRGARSLAPENTLAAARKALEVGADMWELDIRMTADGELIVLHDSTLERTSNVEDVFPGRKPWLAHEFRLSEIRQLDFGSWFRMQDPFGQIAAGVVTESDLADYAGEPMPTLREALAFTLDNDWQVNLEIKDLGDNPGHPHIVEKVVSVLQELDMADQVLISSFHQDYLARLRKIPHHFPTALLVSKSTPHPGDLLGQLGARAYHPRKTAVHSKDIARLRRLGFAVHVWNVNDQKTMRKLVKAGVSGIFTDFPQVLASVLASHGE